MIDGLRYLPIPNYPTHFVSENGDVYSTRLKRHLKTRVGRHGRLIISIKSPEVVFDIHRLVLRLFVGEPPPGLPQIGYRDGDKSNGHYSNMVWTKRTMTYTKPKPKNGPRFHPVYQLHKKTRRVVAVHPSTKAVADIYGIDRGTIYTVMGKAQTYKGFYWTQHPVTMKRETEYRMIPHTMGRYEIDLDGQVFDNVENRYMEFGTDPVTRLHTVTLTEVNGEVDRVLAHLMFELFNGERIQKYQSVGYFSGDRSDHRLNNLHVVDKPQRQYTQPEVKPKKEPMGRPTKKVFMTDESTGEVTVYSSVVSARESTGCPSPYYYIENRKPFKGMFFSYDDPSQPFQVPYPDNDPDDYKYKLVSE